MTIELFIGGLMILTLVAGVVIAMTTTRNSSDRRLGNVYGSGDSRDARSTPKR